MNLVGNTLIFIPFKNPLLIPKYVFYIYFLPTHMFMDILPEYKLPKNCTVFCCFRHTGVTFQPSYKHSSCLW